MKSVITALLDVQTALVDLYERWSDNSEGVDLNELDSVNHYPFSMSLDELILKYKEYVELTEAEIEQSTKFNIITASSDYTGGGIYVYYGIAEFYGKLAYYLADDTNNATMILDRNPIDLDISLTYEWQREHTIGELDGVEHLAFMDKMLTVIITAQPSGNYDVSELEYRRSLIRNMLNISKGKEI